jgi:hypothetical protein
MFYQIVFLFFFMLVNCAHAMKRTLENIELPSESQNISIIDLPLKKLSKKSESAVKPFFVSFKA